MRVRRLSSIGSISMRSRERTSSSQSIIALLIGPLLLGHASLSFEPVANPRPVEIQYHDHDQYGPDIHRVLRQLYRTRHEEQDRDECGGTAIASTITVLRTSSSHDDKENLEDSRDADASSMGTICECEMARRSIDREVDGSACGNASSEVCAREEQQQNDVADRKSVV